MAAEFGRLQSLGKPGCRVVRTVTQDLYLVTLEVGNGQQGHLSIVSRTEPDLQAKRASGEWKTTGSSRLS